MATRAAPVAAHLAALSSGGVPISSDDQNPPADDEYYSDSDDQQLSARGESEDAGEESAAFILSLPRAAFLATAGGARAGSRNDRNSFS